MATRLIICDTDVLIDYFDVRKPRHYDTKIIIEQEILLNQVVISAITKMELLFGAANKTELNRIDRLIKRFDLLLIDENVTRKAIDLLKTYRLSHGLSIPDSFIAATSLITNLELFTYNTKDYKFINNIKLFDFNS